MIVVWRNLFIGCVLLVLGIGVIHAGSPLLAGEAPSLAAPALTVVSDDNYPPYIFRDSDGTLEGYLVDAWALWERKTGRKVNLVGTDWSEAQRIMASGHADVIETMFKTPEREAVYAFSAAYADIPVSIYVNNAIGGITTPKSLQGFLVGAKAGDACIGQLKTLGGASIKPFENYEKLVEAAAAQKIRIFCLDEPPANYLLYKLGAYRSFYKAFVLYSGQFHRAVHKDNPELLREVQAGFDSFTDSERKALKDKWMGSRVELAPYIRYVGYAMALAGSFGGLLGVWIWFLRREVGRRTREVDSQRHKLRTLVQAIPDLIWLKDLDGVYVVCNSAFERFFGAAESEIVGKTDYDFVDWELDRKSVV